MSKKPPALPASEQQRSTDVETVADFVAVLNELSSSIPKGTGTGYTGRFDMRLTRVGFDLREERREAVAFALAKRNASRIRALNCSSSTFASSTPTHPPVPT